MLRELYIKNVAVIDEVRIEFSEGFNVLTGETGAGKSILIDSINMALGGRCSRDIIRAGCDFALANLCFEVSSTHIESLLSDLGIDTEDSILTISRKISADGKSVFRINFSAIFLPCFCPVLPPTISCALSAKKHTIPCYYGVFTGFKKIGVNLDFAKNENKVYN